MNRRTLACTEQTWPAMPSQYKYLYEGRPADQKDLIEQALEKNNLRTVHCDTCQCNWAVVLFLIGRQATEAMLIHPAGHGSRTRGGITSLTREDLCPKCAPVGLDRVFFCPVELVKDFNV
jgi:hypothetical protein